MKRFSSCLMALVLAMGLMPLPAFADYRTGESASVGTADAGLVEPIGLCLVDGDVEVGGSNGYGISECFGILGSYVANGEVAVVFEGSKAPRLVLYDAKQSSKVVLYSKDTDAASGDSTVTWNEGRSAGIARFSSEWIVSKWTEGGKSIDSLRKLAVQADGKNIALKRIVLTGVSPLPDVSNGSYGTDKAVRRLYTRPVTLKTSPDSGDRLYRSIDIDFDNPIYDGADLAVRYKGDAPYLMFCDANWAGWTSMGVGEGARTVDASDKSGERVTFFTRAEIDALWRERGGANGAKRESMFVCVHPQGTNYPAGSEECHLVEVVALGGAERVSLTDEQLHKVSGQSAQAIVGNMKAGYNMAGHFESNYVPKTSVKDGGWGSSDIASEAHWSRGVYITRDTIRNLKKEGFNAIRLPVTWFQHIYPIGDPTGDSSLRSDLANPLDWYHIDRAFLERVHEVVDWCIAEGMYVIVNMHHEDWIDRPDLATAYDETDLPAKFKAVWTQIANEFSGYDQRLVFEDMNEPHAYIPLENGKRDWGFASEESVQTVNRLNADFVSLMRSFPEESGHRGRLLMLAHDTGEGEVSYTGFEWPEDRSNLLAASVHCYTPHSWTHYFAEGAHAGEDGSDNVYTEAYRNEVDAAWDRIRMRYTSQGHPVVLGEFGCYYYTEARQADRLDWMTQFAKHAKELGVPLFYWSMDRTKKDAQGNEYVEWSAFNEQTQEVSALSKDMLKRWFDTLADGGVKWGSRATVGDDEHADMEAGLEVRPRGSTAYPVVVVSRQKGGELYYRKLDASWDDIRGSEVAVKYSGNAPRLQAFKGYAGDYWGLAPDTVDYRKGIAYYSASSIKTRWEAVVASNARNKADGKEYDERLVGSTVEDIDAIGVCAADSGSSTPTDAKLETTVAAVSILHAHEWGPWTKTGVTASGDVLETRVCVQDGARQERTVPTTGHCWNGGETIARAAVHVEGVRSYTCLICGTTREESIPALDHDWGEWEVVREPTYDEPGLERRACKTDGSHVEEREIPPLARAADGLLATRGVAAKAGKTAVVVDVNSDGTATLKKAKSAKGAVKIGAVKTADGRTLKVTAIAPGAFAGSKVTKVTLGATVKKVGKGAFKNSKKLKSAAVGKNVKTVGKGVFKGCKKLKTLKVRSAKLTRKSCAQMLSGSKVKTVKLVGMSKARKKKVAAQYAKWLPKGVVVK